MVTEDRCRSAATIAAGAVVLVSLAGPAAAESAADDLNNLQNLSIEELSNLQITSVSKQDQPLGEAAASVYVITADDIRRSGATTVPEMLRLAPNLFVAQLSPSNHIITARGFSGNLAAQNFTNKLLVLIDGRSVYNPLFSGMYWDMQDVLPANIERIEVISGPGATLWGANAVNGVINIVTRKSSETQGGLVEFGYGNLRASGSAQYGGKLGDNATYRAYVKAFRDEPFEQPNGTDAHDGWTKPQLGFRVDWAPDGELLTFQGDLYKGREDQLGLPDQIVSGGNLQATWQHKFDDGSAVQVLAYYDAVARRPDTRNGGFTVDTFNIEFQHSFAWGSWNKFVWGAGHRLNDYKIVPEIGATSLIFSPGSGQLNLTNFFVQDQMSLADDFDLILGIKLENDPYSGLSPMPNIRATWRPDEGNMFWAAVSRAIRSPTPFDTDVIEMLGPTVFLTGDPNFKPETVIAYELGYRAQLSPRASLSITLYDHEYDDLKSIETTAGGLPLLWGNMMEGRVYGAEIWGNYQAAEWWRLSFGLALQEQELRFAPGASTILGVAQAGDDPAVQAFVRSSMNLADGVTWQADLRYVGELPNPQVASYIELNSRLGWAVMEHLELSLVGTNLLHDSHREFTAPPADEIPRGVFFETRWTF